MLQEGARGGEDGEEGAGPTGRGLNATAIRDPGPWGAAGAGVPVWVAEKVQAGLAAWPSAAGSATARGTGSPRPG